METEVLDEITNRSECLMEMFQMIEASAAEKPSQAMVESIDQTFKAKSKQLRQQMSQKFREMQSQLKVQEQICDTILKKNLSYVENELKCLKSIDYSKFKDAEIWLKKTKVKLDNF